LIETEKNIKIVEANLFKFYHTLAKILEFKYGKIGNNLFYIWAQTEPFPNYIFGDANAKKMAKIVDGIEQDILPKYWICKNYLNNKKLIESHNFKKLLNWYSMILKLKDQPKTLDADFIKIKPASLNQFVHILNENNFKKSKISNKFFNELLKYDDAFSMYGYQHQNRLVSIILAFCVNEVTGLYFLCTKKEYQGKGYATTFIKNVLAAERNRGAKLITLQANSLSKKMFEKFQFKNCGSFAIYGYVGK